MTRPGVLGTAARRPAGDAVLRARDERLAALKAVVAKLTHDFNNVLAPQFGYRTLISEALPSGNPAAQYLKTMEGVGRATEEYIESILLAVRPQRQYTPRNFDLDDLLEKALEEWAGQIPAGAGVSIEREIQSAPLLGDERHWRKVVEHLLSNVRYALATGGFLSVALTPVELSYDETTRLGLETRNVYCLQVRDTGFGISEWAIGRVFDPFFSTRSQARGSGLGLTIVHSVVHFHGGQVELSSANDQGTTVTLWIPRVAPLPVRSGSSSVVQTKRRKVLLVEDDPIVEQVLRGWLQALDFEVKVAPTPGEAVKILARDGSGLSLVITETVFKEGRAQEVFAASSKVWGLKCLFLARGDMPMETGLVIAKPISMSAFVKGVLKHARESNAG